MKQITLLITTTADMHGYGCEIQDSDGKILAWTDNCYPTENHAIRDCLRQIIAKNFTTQGYKK